MQIDVLYFGILKDLAGERHQTLQLPDEATVNDAVRLLRAETSNGNDAFWSSLAVAVNREYAAATTVLHDGDEVALLPPVSGGSGEGAKLKVALQREKIESEHIVAALKAGEDGALVVFDGIVRNNTRGRSTLYLDYEAYEEMALQKMQALAVEALATFAIRDVAIVHRLGRLEIGESSVLIVVASAHRGAAFDACRWVIDTLKKTVPIWKKEYFVDGAVWADGEPFPKDLVSGPLTAARG